MDKFTALNFNIIPYEVQLIILTSIIGVCFHQYITKKKFNLSAWVNMIIVVMADTIICISLDPLISQVQPRLIILPPFLLGLLGNELLRKLSNIKGSTGFIDLILTTLGIKKSNSNGNNSFSLNINSGNNATTSTITKSNEKDENKIKTIDNENKRLKKKITLLEKELNEAQNKLKNNIGTKTYDIYLEELKQLKNKSTKK